MAKEVTVRYVRDDGKELIVDNTTFGIPNDGLEGVDFAKWSLYSETLALKDGSVITGGSYSGRSLVLQFECKRNDDTTDSVRNNVRSFFNPKHAFNVYVTYRGITRWISGMIEGFEAPTENVYKRPEFKVGIYCADPFFKSVDSFGKDIASISPMWGWPFISTDVIHPVFSVYSFDPYIYIDNDGDEEAPLIARMTFDGPVTNPRIIQGYNEKYFQLNGTFGVNDTLIIDFENDVVLHNGVKAFNLIEKGSADLTIPVGVTLYSIGSAREEDNILLHCFLSFYKRYGGI